MCREPHRHRRSPLMCSWAGGAASCRGQTRSGSGSRSRPRARECAPSATVRRETDDRNAGAAGPCRAPSVSVPISWEAPASCPSGSVAPATGCIVCCGATRTLPPWRRAATSPVAWPPTSRSFSNPTGRASPMRAHRRGTASPWCRRRGGAATLEAASVGHRLHTPWPQSWERCRLWSDCGSSTWSPASGPPTTWLPTRPRSR
jgi:hypothetical protein